MASETGEELSSSLAALREKGPAGVELELRSLSPEWGGSSELCGQFLRATAASLASRRSFEATQAHLALFLKLHGDLVASDGELAAALEEVAVAHREATTDLEAELGAATSLAAFCRNALV